MRSFTRLLALTASLTLALAVLALPIRPAYAAPTSSTATYHVVAAYNAAVFVNGLPAQVGATYLDGDVLSITAGLGGYTVLSRTSSGLTSTWTQYGSGLGTFQAIWIGDD